MRFGPESFIIAVVFILPGFIATHIRSSRNPTPPKKKSAFQETLSSITTSIPIFLFQLFVLAILYQSVDTVQNGVNFVILKGFSSYVTTYPVNAMLSALGWGFAVLVISIVTGFLDPIERIATWNRQRIGVPERDFWYEWFSNKPQQEGYSEVYMRVRLKSGPCYTGWLGAFELERGEKKYRLFLLKNARRWRTDNNLEAGETGELIQTVLLRYDADVISIDTWWASDSSETSPILQPNKDTVNNHTSHEQ